MTREEMMFPFLSVVVDHGVEKKQLNRVVRGQQSDGVGLSTPRTG
jgi:hypothetical protein